MSLEITRTELALFDAVAGQIGLAREQVLQQPSKKIADSDGYRSPCVDFHEDGRVKTLTLHTDFPKLIFREHSIHIDCTPLAKLERRLHRASAPDSIEERHLACVARLALRAADT